MRLRAATLLLLECASNILFNSGRVKTQSTSRYTLVEESEKASNETQADDWMEVPLVLGELENQAISPFGATVSDSCRIFILGDDIHNPQPVFLKTNSTDFYPHSAEGFLHLQSNETMQMWCSSGFTLFAGQQLLTATCVGGSRFRVGVAVAISDFTEFTCKSWPTFAAQNIELPCNGGDSILIRVGFEISPHRFAEQMLVCFNELEEVTRYVRHSLSAGNHFYQTNINRIAFQTSDFFGGKDVNKLYAQDTQQQTINTELGGQGVNQYFNVSRNLYLTRGHIAAKADFVFGPQQRATFLFINAAPQWQVFNAGNWARIEDSLRSWIWKQQISVVCYTGVWGVATLPNVHGIETPLYLARDENNNNGLIPVPKIYFRVVIEPASGRGIVFVGVNNPHVTSEQIIKDYVICKDVSDRVTYISWKKTDIRAGYSYACEVEDFLQKVPYLPELSAPGGLLV